MAKKRVELCLEKKVELIEAVKANLKTTHKQFAQQFGCGKTDLTMGPLNCGSHQSLQLLLTQVPLYACTNNSYTCSPGVC